MNLDLGQLDLCTHVALEENNGEGNDDNGWTLVHHEGGYGVLVL